MQTVILNSGQKMPILGLGTWQLKGEKCTEAVKNAIKQGYRHIDTADMYGNHKDIAPALKECQLDRSELFITSKVSRIHLYYNDLLNTAERILDELGVDYLDLLLIHWPNSNIPLEETLKAMAELKEEGKARNIGVSNFTETHLERAMEIYPDLLSVNQVEFHPYLYQKELLDFCQKNDIVLTAYSPLARGKIFKDQQIMNIAQKYRYSPAQLVLRWLMEKKIVVIPKASSFEHLKDNFQVLDLDIPTEALKELDNLNKDERIVAPDFNEFDLSK